MIQIKFPPLRAKIVSPSVKLPVFEGYIEFVKKVQAELPQTPIYYISITPTPSRWKNWPIVQQANQLIRAYTETNDCLHFIDMTKQYLGPDGRPKRDLYI